MKYREGTIVQHRNHIRYVKVEGKMMAEHRLVAERDILNRELMSNERVFHLNCDRIDDNDSENLVVISFRTNKFRPLPESRVIYVPKEPR